jgi:hypothetical protein
MDPDDAVEAWHEDEEDPDLVQYLMREFNWNEEETENWIATGEVPVRDE